MQKANKLDVPCSARCVKRGISVAIREIHDRGGFNPELRRARCVRAGAREQQPRATATVHHAEEHFFLLDQKFDHVEAPAFGGDMQQVLKYDDPLALTRVRVHGELERGVARRRVLCARPKQPDAG